MPSDRLPRVLCLDDDEDGLLGSIKLVVSRAESPIPKIILFGRKMSFSPPLPFEPAAA